MKKKENGKHVDDDKRQADAERAIAEARMNATRGALPKPRPFRIGCALFVVLVAWSVTTFGVAIGAAVCAHRWGLS